MFSSEFSNNGPEGEVGRQARPGSSRSTASRRAARSGMPSPAGFESQSISSFPPHQTASEGWLRRRGMICSASVINMAANSASSGGWLSTTELDWMSSCQTRMP